MQLRLDFVVLIEELTTPHCWQSEFDIKVVSFIKNNDDITLVKMRDLYDMLADLKQTCPIDTGKQAYLYYYARIIPDMLPNLLLGTP